MKTIALDLVPIASVDPRTTDVRWTDARTRGLFQTTQAWKWEATPEVAAGDALVVLAHGMAWIVARVGDRVSVELWDSIAHYFRCEHGLTTTVAPPRHEEEVA